MTMVPLATANDLQLVVDELLEQSFRLCDREDLSAAAARVLRRFYMEAAVVGGYWILEAERPSDRRTEGETITSPR